MTQTKFKKVPFNLELAKKITNKEVKGRIISRDGHQARIICFDKDRCQGDYPIVALIQLEPTDERMYTFSEKGIYNVGNECCWDLHLEVPTYYRDYSDFKPCQLQPCVVRDNDEEVWDISVCKGRNSVGEATFYHYGCTYKHCLPLSKVTERLVNTRMSYEELIKELDAEYTKNKQQ